MNDDFLGGGLSSIFSHEDIARSMLRSPYDSELQFFKDNTHIGGMATDDDRIILNPHSPLSEREKHAVMMNEFYRLLMKKIPSQTPLPTFDQLQSFSTYGSPRQIGETVMGRLMSGDPSAGTASPQQTEYMNLLRQADPGILSNFRKGILSK